VSLAVIGFGVEKELTGIGIAGIGIGWWQCQRSRHRRIGVGGMTLTASPWGSSVSVGKAWTESPSAGSAWAPTCSGFWYRGARDRGDKLEGFFIGGLARAPMSSGVSGSEGSGSR